MPESFSVQPSGISTVSNAIQATNARSRETGAVPVEETGNARAAAKGGKNHA